MEGLNRQKKTDLDIELYDLREKLAPVYRIIDQKSWQISEIEKEIEDINRNPYGKEQKTLNTDEQKIVEEKIAIVSNLKQEIKDLRKEIETDPASKRIKEIFKLFNQEN